MTVNTTDITSGPFIGTNLVATYDYDFRIENKNQIRVFETTDLGVKTELVVDTDFTVAGIGEDAGGQITRVAGNLPTDYEWYMRADYSSVQSRALRSQGGFFPDVHEAALDHLTFLIQQIEDQILRSFKLSEEIDIDGTFTFEEDAVTRASKFLGFDASGNLITADGVTGVPVSTFVATLMDDATAVEFLATLGITVTSTGITITDYIKTLLDDANANTLWSTLQTSATHDFASDADYSLTTAQQEFHRIVLTDTGVVLTAARNLVVPDTIRGWYIQNDTAQSITVKTSAGTGILVAPSEATYLYCDGTNVIDPLTGVSGGATGGGPDDIFYENSQTVENDYTITSGKNAMSAGPITIDTGVTVTIPAGSTWVIA